MFSHFKTILGIGFFCLAASAVQPVFGDHIGVGIREGRSGVYYNTYYDPYSGGGVYYPGNYYYYYGNNAYIPYPYSYGYYSAPSYNYYYYSYPHYYSDYRVKYYRRH